MSFSTKTYDADRVSVIFGGISIDSGLADGEFVKIEMSTDAFTSVVGTDGEVTRSKTNDRRAKGAIRVMQTSAGNAALSALHLLDLGTANGAGVVPLLIKDNNGDTVIEAEQAWLTKYPAVSFDRGAVVHEWAFECQNPKFILAGN